jgi:hypothetical protein
MFRNTDTAAKAERSLTVLVSALLFERSQEEDFQLGYSITLVTRLDFNTR